MCVWSPESFITRAKENFHMKVNFEFWKWSMLRFWRKSEKYQEYQESEVFEVQ